MKDVIIIVTWCHHSVTQVHLAPSFSLLNKFLFPGSVKKPRPLFLGSQSHEYADATKLQILQTCSKLFDLTYALQIKGKDTKTNSLP